MEKSTAASVSVADLTKKIELAVKKVAALHPDLMTDNIKIGIAPGRQILGYTQDIGKKLDPKMHLQIAEEILEATGLPGTAVAKVRPHGKRRIILGFYFDTLDADFWFL